MSSARDSIFRSYDIRGSYPGDFDTQFAQRFGARVTQWLPTGPIIIGRDARATSDELAYAVVDGALYTGAQIIDVGVVSTPQFYWAIRSRGATGGIMITASHNPAQDNGFKVIASRGGVLEVVGGDVLRQIVDVHEHGAATKGTIEFASVLEGYAAAVAYAASWQGGRELVTSCDGPQAVQAVLERLGPIATSDTLAVRFDADGDRVNFFESGQQIPSDFIFLLLAEYYGYAPLVFDLRFSKTLRQRLDARRVPYEVSAVGRVQLTQAMHRLGAQFGGETSGHFYWKEFGGMECPELTMLRVLEIMRSSKQSLTSLTAPYRLYAKSEELTVPLADRKHADSLMRVLQQKYEDAHITHVDGVTIEYEEWWCTVRPSNTEPLLRIVVEAINKKILDQAIEEVMKILHQGR